MTAEPLQSLLSRVREAKPGIKGETERRAIAKDWCALREDYPSICRLIVDALSDHRVALGSAIALAERVLPGRNGHVNFGRSPTQAGIFDNTTDRWDYGIAATPALALVAATISALIASNPKEI